MEITSSSFKHNEAIPNKYTCDGENISPALSISGIPEGSKSLALVVSDPDAPSGNFIHWLVWNIDITNPNFPEGSIPPGAVEGTTSFGKANYGGPCPPSGTHRYFFKVYALDKMLELPTTANEDELNKAMDGHILEQAELLGLYQRSLASKKISYT